MQFKISKFYLYGVLLIQAGNYWYKKKSYRAVGILLQNQAYSYYSAAKTEKRKKYEDINVSMYWVNTLSFGLLIEDEALNFASTVTFVY